MKLKNWIISLMFIGFLMFSNSCNKNNPYEDFPVVTINTSIRPNSTLYQNLNIVGGWEYITAPYPSKGIIVYRFSQNEFRAYERTCPHDPHTDCRIMVEETYTTAIDSCCMTRYILYDGSPFDGPGLYPLRQYQTYYDGVNLNIFN